MLKNRIVLILALIHFGFLAQAKTIAKDEAKELKAVVKTPAVSDAPEIFTSAYIDDALKSAAQKANVPFPLLKAICRAESNLNPRAYVYNDGGDKAGSAFGLCQVLRATAMEFVGDHKGCYSDFRGRMNDRTYKNCKLFGPRTNALAAAKYLSKHIKRYGNLAAATAAYNAGTVKICRKGKVRCSENGFTFRCTPGELLNGYYVDRVQSYLGNTFSDLAEAHEVGSLGRDVIGADFVRALNIYGQVNKMDKVSRGAS